MTESWPEINVLCLSWSAWGHTKHYLMRAISEGPPEENFFPPLSLPLPPTARIFFGWAKKRYLTTTWNYNNILLLDVDENLETSVRVGLQSGWKNGPKSDIP